MDRDPVTGMGCGRVSSSGRTHLECDGLQPLSFSGIMDVPSGGTHDQSTICLRCVAERAGAWDLHDDCAVGTRRRKRNSNLIFAGWDGVDAELCHRHAGAVARRVRRLQSDQEIRRGRIALYENDETPNDE